MSDVQQSVKISGDRWHALHTRLLVEAPELPGAETFDEIQKRECTILVAVPAACRWDSVPKVIMKNSRGFKNHENCFHSTRRHAAGISLLAPVFADWHQSARPPVLGARNRHDHLVHFEAGGMFEASPGVSRCMFEAAPEMLVLVSFGAGRMFEAARHGSHQT